MGFIKNILSKVTGHGSGERSSGKVKWFDNKKGYGFIITDSGKDVFVHYSEIKQDGYKTLEEGQSVELEVIENDKGYKAKNVKVAS